MKLRSGFSLVELSIVLVILGLLTGGILAGRSLVKASELRAVSSEHQRFATATNAFREKYFQLPGDMNNAESVWSQLEAVAATCRTTASTTALTCNGDGDGSIESSTSRSYEIYRYWQHLANAGMIEGQYTGTYGTNATTWHAMIGTNVPRSKYPNGGWGAIAHLDIAQQGGWFTNIFPPSNALNWLEFGTHPSGVTSYLNDPLLSVQDAWNLDTKMDDGKPGTGKVTTFNNTRNANCASSDTAASATYPLSSTQGTCTMFLAL